MSVKYQRVSLRVQYHTQIGEDVFVAGSLWGWNNPMLMTWTNGAYWEFTFGVPVTANPTRDAAKLLPGKVLQPAGGPSPDPLAENAALTSPIPTDSVDISNPEVPRAVLEYKYFVRQRLGGRVWEPSNNRRIPVIIDASGGDRTWLVADVWMQPALTKAVWGRTAQERLIIAQQKLEEDKRASEAGMRFFRENLERNKEESAQKRRELELELLAAENARLKKRKDDGVKDDIHAQVAHKREEALKAIHTVVESPHLRPKPYTLPPIIDDIEEEEKE